MRQKETLCSGEFKSITDGLPSVPAWPPSILLCNPLVLFAYSPKEKLFQEVVSDLKVHGTRPRHRGAAQRLPAPLRLAVNNFGF